MSSLSLTNLLKHTEKEPRSGRGGISKRKSKAMMTRLKKREEIKKFTSKKSQNFKIRLIASMSCISLLLEKFRSGSAEKNGTAISTSLPVQMESSISIKGCPDLAARRTTSRPPARQNGSGRMNQHPAGTNFLRRFLAVILSLLPMSKDYWDMGPPSS